VHVPIWLLEVPLSFKWLGIVMASNAVKAHMGSTVHSFMSTLTYSETLDRWVANALAVSFEMSMLEGLDCFEMVMVWLLNGVRRKG